MGWQNYKWAWNLRGVTPSEQIVCLYLADQADGAGRIEKLSHGRISRRIPGLGYERVRKILRTLSAEKRLITMRTPRKGVLGQQISNAYQLDLNRYHPPDTTGDRLWNESRQALIKSRPADCEALKIYSADTTAWYEAERKILFVWLESKRSVTYFETRVPDILQTSKNFNPAIYRFNFLQI